jgi:multiple sugar transport system permease protein
MSIALTPTPIEADYRPRLRRRRRWTKIGTVVLSTVLLIWTLLPIYNMFLIALSDDGDEFSGYAWPEDWNWDSFRVVVQQDYWYLEHFWRQLGNSFYMATATMMLTVLIASLVSFALGRMRLRRAWLVTNIALLTYALPTAFLLIPFIHLMRVYGLTDSLWSVIAAEVTFATPYAILVLNGYSKLIPLELDESAKVDGATPLQMYFRIYLPLMAPALVAVGVYAMLLAWNEYVYQYLLISSPRNATVAVAMTQFFDSDEAPWNYMMATALIYSLPPVAIYFVLRRYMIAGLTMGAVKG